MSKSIGFSQTRFDDNATMLLYRLHPDSTWHCLTRLTVRRFNLLWMCKRYGPGRYLVCVMHHGFWIQQQCRITGGRVIRRHRWTVRWG